MKIKKGRIFLKKEKLKNEYLSENISKGYGILRKIFTLNNRCRLRIDPRPVSDKSYIYSCILDVTFFLDLNEFDLKFTQNFFLKPTNRDFFCIFLFLLRKIDPSFQFVKKFEENMPFLLKIIKYPFFICKSYFYSIASPHTWPVLISCLKWITELLSYQSRLEKDGTLETFPFFFKKVFWNEMISIYHKNLSENRRRRKFIRILWAYSLFKVNERIIFGKSKKKKFFNVQMKIKFYKQIFLLFSSFANRERKKTKFLRFFHQSYKSINIKTNLALLYVNLNIKFYDNNRKNIFLLKIKDAKKKDLEKMKKLKYFETEIKIFSDKELENYYIDLFYFFQITKKFVSILRFFIFSKTFLLKMIFFIFATSISILSKNLFFFYFCTIFSFSLGKNNSDINSYNKNLIFFKIIKLFLKNIITEVYFKRSLQDKIENIYFLVREKELFLNIILYLLKIKYSENMDTLDAKFCFVYHEIEDFYIFVLLLKNRYLESCLILRSNVKQIIISKLRCLLTVNFLTQKLKFVFLLTKLF
nr:hypothetical protein 1634Bnrm1_p069 [Cryptomonas sp.]